MDLRLGFGMGLRPGGAVSDWSSGSFGVLGTSFGLVVQSFGMGCVQFRIGAASRTEGWL